MSKPIERTEKSKLIIVVTYSDNAYLYKLEGSTKHVFLARLNDLDAISKKLDISKNEAFDLLLKLVRERRERTIKHSVRELMDLILSNPELYFGL